MPLKFNPFTAQFDLTGSGGGAQYIDGEVANFAALPTSSTTAPLNSAWLVRTATGTWFTGGSKPAGIYIRTATTGTLATDWTYAGTLPDVFSDANFTIYDDADTSKNLKFQLSGITTGTTRTLSVPNASGTLAFESDLIYCRNIVLPTVSGTSLFSLTNGAWTASPDSFTYQWQRSTNGTSGWENLNGETSPYYQGKFSDNGKYVRVGVIAINENGSGSIAYSLSSNPINASINGFPTANLLAFYRLSNVVDATGNGYTLTNNNGATFSAGHIGNAVDLSPTSDQYLSSSTFLNPIPAAGTFSLWISTTNGEQTGVIISRYSTNGGIQLYVDGESIVADIRNATAINTGFTIGEWNHIVFTWSSGVSKLYVNGALAVTGSFSEVGNSTNIPFIIGANSDGAIGSYNFEGSIDAVGIWNRALVLGEVQALYNSGVGLELA